MLLQRLYLFAALGVFVHASSYTSNQAVVSKSEAPAALTDWLVIGPFQIGTREAPWGADPLEKHGGFPNISYDADNSFGSSLAPNGEVRWSVQKAKSVNVTDRGYKVFLEFNFPDIDWNLLQSAYGWAAFQYQIWTRGRIFVDENQTLTRLLVFTDNVIEYAIDGVRVFGGDLYRFRRAPLVLYLDGGEHTVDLRLIRDVRVLGGVGDPTVRSTLEFQTVIDEVITLDGSAIVSTIVDGRLASPYASITVCNKGRDPIKLLGFKSGENAQASFVREEYIHVANGQTRPVAFMLSLSDASVSTAQLTLLYRSGGTSGAIFELSFSISFLHLSKYHVHKVTHLHPGGIVSYSILRPPSPQANCKPGQETAPVLLQLHGAGLEADNFIVGHSLDPLPNLCAWVIFPTGVTPWSGDDWHTWGFADIRAAIGSIPSWIKTMQWDGIGVDTDHWLVSGHSNGGQGTTYIMTHWPDNVIGSAPVSGYLSIPQYVPFSFWRPMESRKRMVLDAALNSWRLELLIENAKDVPLQLQHGSADVNVPVYHSRLMYQLLGELGSSSSNFTEIKGARHWFWGVMTTESLTQFYQSILDGATPSSAQDGFSFVVANPTDFGSKQGFKIDLLEDPSQLGRINVAKRSKSMTEAVATTENILQFSLDITYPSVARQISVDEQTFDISNISAAEHVTFWRERRKAKAKNWCSSINEKPPTFLRTGRQLGGIDSLLRTEGPIIINCFTPEAFSLAVEISRNLHTYYYADSQIVGPQATSLPAHSGNRITLALGAAFPPRKEDLPFPIQLSSTDPHRLSFRNHEGLWHHITATEGSLGAIWVEPLSDERVNVMLWGEDVKGLEQAARLVPTVTGVGVPDFVVLDGKAKWNGANGVLAMGFFDSFWNSTASSFVAG